MPTALVPGVCTVHSASVLESGKGGTHVLTTQCRNSMLVSLGTERDGSSQGFLVRNLRVS
jgi:hypothetical protein